MVWEVSKKYKASIAKTKKPVKRSDGTVYTSIKKAAKVLLEEQRTNARIETIRKQIKSSLNNPNRTAYGFNWEYVEKV